MKDFLGISGLRSGRDLERLVDSAARLRHDRRFSGEAPWPARGSALFFEKPSTRTRVSGEVAAVELGAYPVVLGQDGSRTRF